MNHRGNGSHLTIRTPAKKQDAGATVVMKSLEIPYQRSVMRTIVKTETCGRGNVQTGLALQSPLIQLLIHAEKLTLLGTVLL